MNPETVQQASEAIRDADGLLVCAGAGMGADSGLPTFRGDDGFWKAYPALANLKIRFVEMANPQWFVDDPERGWAFYGHRHQLYSVTEPHEGFQILRKWANPMPIGTFVFTSNVDGHFQKAGFPRDRVHECHGSIMHLQCISGCRNIWPAEKLNLDIDMETLRARGELPACPDCGTMARPNILMFSDWGWVSERSDQQERQLDEWIRGGRDRQLVIIEIGAGMAVPTVRYFSEEVAQQPGATLIRINTEAPEGPPGTISMDCGALEALQAIDGKLTVN